MRAKDATGGRAPHANWLTAEDEEEEVTDMITLHSRLDSRPTTQPVFNPGTVNLAEGYRPHEHSGFLRALDAVRVEANSTFVTTIDEAAYPELVSRVPIIVPELNVSNGGKVVWLLPFRRESIPVQM